MWYHTTTVRIPKQHHQIQELVLNVRICSGQHSMLPQPQNTMMCNRAYMTQHFHMIQISTHLLHHLTPPLLPHPSTKILDATIHLIAFTSERQKALKKRDHPSTQVAENNCLQQIALKMLPPLSCQKGRCSFCSESECHKLSQNFINKFRSYPYPWVFMTKLKTEFHA